MPERRCCAGCFGDHQIEDQYIPQSDPATQDCGYCGAQNVLCVEPNRLGPWFETLLATYETSGAGLPIVELLIKEWNMFGGSGMSSSLCKELLGEVLNDGEIVRQTFAPIEHPEGGNLRLWEDLRDELMHQNRWFLDEPMDMERIAELLDQLIARPTEIGNLSWYRARLMSGEEPYEITKMGAPPRHLAGHGRANPAGIPYLYLGSTKETAVAELRPHTGEKACVARFHVPQLKFADLRDPRGLISPLVGDESTIIRLRADLPLLERLGSELTRPVQPSGAPFEYIPTQYLCEYVKNRGFDGVVYRSSVSGDNGINVALFDPERAHAIDVEVIEVAKVSVTLK